MQPRGRCRERFANPKSKIENPKSPIGLRRARSLADRRGSGVLVLCGPGEEGMARRIVELGKHDELLALDGYYASLYQKQQLEEELTVAG